MGLLWHTALVGRACSKEVAFAGSEFASKLFAVSQSEPFFIRQIMHNACYVKLENQSQIYQLIEQAEPEIVLTKNQSYLPQEILSLNEIRRIHSEFMLTVSELTNELQLDRWRISLTETTDWDQFKMLSIYDADEVAMLETTYRLKIVAANVISQVKPQSLGTGANSDLIAKLISNHLVEEIRNIYNLLVYNSTILKRANR